jgi:hypothetical protein
VTEIAQENGTIVGQVQTDTFCPGCGYNLHTQAVIRHERMGILICRCPECGRYSAVGQTTTASRAWLNRLATILLTGWVFFLLLIFALGALFLGMIAYGHILEMTQVTQMSGPAPGTAPATYSGAYKFQYTVKPVAEDSDSRASQRWTQFWLTFFAALVGLIVGGLFSTLLWHCKGWLRLPAFLPPLAGCAVAAASWAGDPMSLPIRNWGLRQIGLFLLLELVAVGIGLLIGRRFARGLVRILVPPKARQHLAFLWITDGKVLKPN